MVTEVRLGGARLEAGGARFRATARLDRTSFGVTKKKGMVGRTVDLVIEAVCVPRQRGFSGTGGSGGAGSGSPG